ncbi:hypothetical protein Csa_020902 [Cucumis sativus]|uniref:Uncharacterized protein n=1 Tax=Cucumis sativus TaxID=3659 RepID=A0A0A0KH63_CUCSA|nr:hypothetical protein Csa_020902 [Cucumis sativus]
MEHEVLNKLPSFFILPLKRTVRTSYQRSQRSRRIEQRVPKRRGRAHSFEVEIPRRPPGRSSRPRVPSPWRYTIARSLPFPTTLEGLHLKRGQIGIFEISY